METDWAHLNDEGKALMGHIFPEGSVPVRSFIASAATLDGQDGEREVYLIEWKELSEEQKDALITAVSQKTGAPKDVILASIEKDGFMPLRKELTCGSGTSNVGMILSMADDDGFESREWEEDEYGDDDDGFYDEDEY